MLNSQKHNKREEFYYKKSYLEHRLQKDVMEDGIAHIPCRVEGIDDIISKFPKHLPFRFSALFLRESTTLLPEAVHAFRIISAVYLFTGMAVFGSAFFTALNNGQISALISFLRTFVFELGSVLMLPVLLGVDGIWYSVVFAELMAAATGGIFMVAMRKKYLY